MEERATEIETKAMERKQCKPEQAGEAGNGHQLEQTLMQALTALVTPDSRKKSFNMEKLLLIQINNQLN